MREMIEKNKELFEILQKIETKFKVFIVGGAVRDFMLGLEPHDFDIATSATPDELNEMFKDSHEVKFVGETFGVTLINGFEVATFRKDKHSGIGDKNCEVEFTTFLGEDLKRRDFTINAMAYDPFHYRFVDAFGGTQDLKDKVLRFVENPRERILQDPNRIIRAARFAARLEFTIEKESLEALTEMSHLIQSHVAVERIALEIMKALENKNASDFFGHLLIMEGLQFVLPSLDVAYEYSDHGKHHVESIWEHLMLVGDSISPKFPLVKLAGYLHDVGKPAVQFEGSFHDHEKEGYSLVAYELSRLKFSTKDVEIVSGLVRCHMYSLSEQTPRAVRRVVKKLKDRNVDFKNFLRLKMADRRGNVKRVPHSLAELKSHHSAIFNVKIAETPFNVKSLCVDGNFIMAEFGLKPSKFVGEVLNHLLAFVVDMGDTFNNETVLVGVAHMFVNSKK